MRPHRPAATTLVAVVALLALAGCSSSGSDAAGTTAPTTAAPKTTTTAPQTYAEAVSLRLADELGDPAQATAVVAGLAPDTLKALETKVPMAEVATSAVLRYRPERAPDDSVDSVVVFSFGNRVAADGTTTAGPTNEALADATAAFVADHPVPVYAQWEVAHILADRGVAGVTSIEPKVAADGATTYLSTAGVAEQAVADASAAGKPLGTVGVVCFADHAVRCASTATQAGMHAVVPEGVHLPTAYDAQSGQAWTRDRTAYITTDLTSRALEAT
ncbi:hypothetical protein [Aquihabitans sp. McL0605]|uniref:hypothetical protein n=1 Tax=Aquihabitans sp. McL0605 TaxID=3415671 RepID=UPI003CFA18DC